MTAATDVAGLRLTLREAAVKLGHATLQARAGEHVAAQLLVCQALRLLMVAEAEVQIIATPARQASEAE